MPRNLSPNSLPSQILSTLLSMVNDYFFLFEHPHAVLYTTGDIDGARQMLQRKERRLRTIEKRKFHRSLSRLQSQNYLKIREQGEQIYISLTDRGIQEGFKRAIIEKKKPLKKKQLCYVSFDVPESAKAVRSHLRRLLKEAGFIMVQLSLWSSTKDVGKEMAVFVSLIGATRWVHVFYATPIIVTKAKPH